MWFSPKEHAHKEHHKCLQIDRTYVHLCASNSRLRRYRGIPQTNQMYQTSEGIWFNGWSGLDGFVLWAKLYALGPRYSLQPRVCC